MNIRSVKLVISFIIAATVSCNEPETVVTNIVHADGSVTRRIEMKNFKNKFDSSAIQVPFDSTWSVRDSFEINTDGDTILVKRAEKLFTGTDEINQAYKADIGANKDLSRRTEFSKKFRWFNTLYRFSELIDKKMKFGYPVEEFLDQDELRWFYSPEYINDEKRNGPDSLMFRSFSDTVEKKIEKWTFKSLVSEWIGEFAGLTGNSTGSGMNMESLKGRENEFAHILEKNSEKFDSLWSNGVLLRELIGEANALEYKTEADSAVKLAVKRFWTNFNGYSTRTIMPGNLTGTNGFFDTTGILLWPVESDFFLTQTYEMWAESKESNLWSWIVSGSFLLFVLAGIIIRSKK